MRAALRGRVDSTEGPAEEKPSKATRAHTRSAKEAQASAASASPALPTAFALASGGKRFARLLQLGALLRGCIAAPQETGLWCELFLWYECLL